MCADALEKARDGEQAAQILLTACELHRRKLHLTGEISATSLLGRELTRFELNHGAVVSIGDIVETAAAARE